MNDLRGDGSLINAWVREMCCRATLATESSFPSLCFFFVSQIWTPVCVCVCPRKHRLFLSFFLPHTYTGLYTANLSSDRSNLNCCISLVVPQPPALPSVTGWQLHKYPLLWWCMRHKSVWMWQLLFVSPSFFFSPWWSFKSPRISNV